MFLQFQITKLPETFHNSIQTTSPATSNILDTLKHFVSPCMPGFVPLVTNPFICNEIPTSASISQISGTYPSLKWPLLHEASLSYSILSDPSNANSPSPLNVSQAPVYPFPAQACEVLEWGSHVSPTLQHFIQFLQYSGWPIKNVLHEWICQSHQ